MASADHLGQRFSTWLEATYASSQHLFANVLAGAIGFAKRAIEIQCCSKCGARQHGVQLLAATPPGQHGIPSVSPAAVRQHGLPLLAATQNGQHGTPSARPAVDLWRPADRTAARPSSRLEPCYGALNPCKGVAIACNPAPHPTRFIASQKPLLEQQTQSMRLPDDACSIEACDRLFRAIAISHAMFLSPTFFS